MQPPNVKLRSVCSGYARCQAVFVATTRKLGVKWASLTGLFLMFAPVAIVTSACGKPDELAEPDWQHLGRGPDFIYLVDKNSIRSVRGGKRAWYRIDYDIARSDGTKEELYFAEFDCSDQTQKVAYTLHRSADGRSIRYSALRDSDQHKVPLLPGTIVVDIFNYACTGKVPANAPDPDIDMQVDWAAIERKLQAREASNTADVTATITRQSSDGLQSSDLTSQFIENLEAYFKSQVRRKAESNLKANGNSDPLPPHESSSLYTQAGGHKVAVVKLGFSEARPFVLVFGIIEDEAVRVTCLRRELKDTPITSGPCDAKIKEAFGGSILQ